ncbi:MAG TPA: aldo/keto reductase [Candidatus Lokiarchaeia archaeon]|nr:aldo/keto reductase [Candidatus Lokiarchaeia archaeon]
MNNRKLGRTGLDVSEIGLGTELLAKNQPADIVSNVIKAAIDGGITFFDVLVMDPAFLQAARIVFQEYRNHIIISGHFGIGIVNGKTTRVRRVNDAIASFHALIDGLGVDHVDVAMLEYVSEKEYPKFIKDGGLIDALKKLKEGGKARFLGLSSHYMPVLTAAIESGTFEVIMTQVNAACSHVPGRRAVYDACEETNTGLVAIKALLGGKLFSPGKKVRIAAYQTGTQTLDFKVPPGITPVHCISHVLAQPGVSVCLVGAQTVEEVKSALEYCTANPEDHDDKSLVSLFSG